MGKPLLLLLLLTFLLLLLMWAAISGFTCTLLRLYLVAVRSCPRSESEPDPPSSPFVFLQQEVAASSEKRASCSGVTRVTFDPSDVHMLARVKGDTGNGTIDVASPDDLKQPELVHAQLCLNHTWTMSPETLSRLRQEVEEVMSSLLETLALRQDKEVSGACCCRKLLVSVELMMSE